MILHLIRHPQPLIEAGICYGRLDIPAENVAACAASLKLLLPGEIAVWSSPLQRCRALAKALHTQPLFDARLMEMNFGTWEGRPWNTIPRDELDAWAADVEGYAPPGGESAASIRQRAVAFVEEQNVPEIALVTHAGVIRLLLAHYQGRALVELLNEPLAFGSLTRLVCVS